MIGLGLPSTIWGAEPHRWTTCSFHSDMAIRDGWTPLSRTGPGHADGSEVLNPACLGPCRSYTINHLPQSGWTRSSRLVEILDPNAWL